MEPGSRNKIIVILGPTASGKSDAAIRLAKKYNGEVISADSRQIYRGMDLGTGKISKAKQRKVKHWLIDVASPKEEYNVSHFKKGAEKIIEAVLKRGKIPIICGGTGFWISAIVDNVIFPEVKPDKKLRKKLEEYSAEKLFKILRKLDLKRAETIDKHNKVRLIRAIEICNALGKVPKINKKNTKYNFLQIGIDIPKDKLHQNIKKRLRDRFRKGLIEEIEKLHRQGLSWKKIQSFGLAYYWIPLQMQNKISKEELFEKVYSAEKDYAKRQMTWFKRDKKIVWINKYSQAEKIAKKFIKL